MLSSEKYILNVLFSKWNTFSTIRRSLVKSINMSNAALKFLNQDEATKLDEDLFNEYRFSVDQLMELAGLSCATAVRKALPLESYGKNVLVICGPGNNGGDGLVAARHLTLFGYKPTILYPKRTPKTLYESLLHQCVAYEIEVLDTCPQTCEVDRTYNIVLDALFGFSFKAPMREVMKPVLDVMINTSLPVCSVDIPSGWNVDDGPPSEAHIKPALLISLSAPKLCATHITNCRHFLGGRFIPPAMQKSYGLNLPDYPDTQQVVELV